MKYIVFIYFLLPLFSCTKMKSKEINDEQFDRIALSISKGWNEGNAKLAAQYFADNAVYEEPPKKQFYKGKENIFEFFGGEKGYSMPMKMKWHNLAFSKESQIGFGEYTFAMNNQYHGIVIMQFENGKILKWREYQYQSSLDWKDFAGESEFETEK